MVIICVKKVEYSDEIERVLRRVVGTQSGLGRQKIFLRIGSSKNTSDFDVL